MATEVRLNGCCCHIARLVRRLGRLDDDGQAEAEVMEGLLQLLFFLAGKLHACGADVDSQHVQLAEQFRLVSCRYRQVSRQARRRHAKVRLRRGCGRGGVVGPVVVKCEEAVSGSLWRSSQSWRCLHGSGYFGAEGGAVDRRAR